MSRRPPIQSPLAPGSPLRSLLSQRSAERTQRITTSRGVRETIVSLAGLLGRPVRNQTGGEVGRLSDLVARWSDDNPYPPVTGLVVKVGPRLAFIDIDLVGRLAHAEVQLRSSRLDLRDFSRREGEVLLAKDVLDHQLIDVDGVQVIRAADLYVAPAAGRIRLVGVDVSVQSLLRRLGPARWRPRPTPDRVIDWAAIQPFADSRREVRLRTSHEGLHRLRPGELADLLEDLGRPARQELLAALDPETAADALEEMDPDELGALLREAEPGKAAALVASMEPDEAVDALRDLGRDDRLELLACMPAEKGRELARLLGYPEDEAGGFMTTALALARPHERVTDVRARLVELADHRSDIDAVAVVDEEGRLVCDLRLFDLVVAGGEDAVASLVSDEEPVTVGPDASLADVAAQLIESRRSSVLVIEDGRPLGRILADDVVDALSPDRGRLHFPRLFQ
ncbi:MAG: magnesium transporter MgtE N-terminal domain-containing protein [Acidimicrobiales bacterium]